MQLSWRQRSVLTKLADDEWHRPARLIDSRLVYQQVRMALVHLHTLGLVERELISAGSLRQRYQYRINDVGRAELRADV